MNFLNEIDNSWTLFLDRDGVINRRPINDYVKSWDEFEFLPGVLESLKIFNQLFRRVIIVTNQQGIGKKVMNEEELTAVHEKMLKTIEESGGRVDQIFHCPDLVSKPNNCRKPGLVMAQKAKRSFPEINFTKSIMAGDTKTDLEFGKNAGMRTVFINTNNETFNKFHRLSWLISIPKIRFISWRHCCHINSITNTSFLTDHRTAMFYKPTSMKLICFIRSSRINTMQEIIILTKRSTSHAFKVDFSS